MRVENEYMGGRKAKLWTYIILLGVLIAGVVVLEAGQVGEGGSGLNGGQVIAGLKHDPDVLESVYGQRVGAQLAACSGSAPARSAAAACTASRSGRQRSAGVF